MDPTPNPALEQLIRAIPLFSLVQLPDLLEILRLLRPVQLTGGQVLFRQGAPGDAMWVLGEGAEVSVSTLPPGNARPVVVAYARAGETVGEMALVDDGPRSGTAVVTQGGSAYLFSAADFHQLRESHRPVAFKVLRRICVDLCARLRATSDRIVPPSGHVLSAPGLQPRPLPSPELLNAFPPFRPLPQVVKLAMAQKLKLVETAGVEPVFGEGQAGDAAYFVVNGEVTVGRSGKTLATLGPGAMFGMVAVIDHGKRSASVITAGPVRLFRLDGPDFEALFAAGNRFAFELVSLVARQLVAHVRGANQLLPLPGGPAPQQAAARGGTPAAREPVPPPQPATSLQEIEAGLPEAELLPMEVELQL
jgi:CRP-like cAMP-binding protein